jgi:hypothetical protein
MLRLLLAGGLIGCGCAALVFARAPSLAPTPLLPAGSRGIIVLDLSSSVEHGTLDRMHAALAQLAATNARFGLVVFSSRAYEALPPNTPARELLPLVSFFRELPLPAKLAYGRGLANPSNGYYPTNPWASGFSSGTAISSGLDLAREIIVASHVSRPSVWLMSDLADDPQDRPEVTRAARAYFRVGIALNVIGLNAAPADKQFFDGLLGPSGKLIQAQETSRVRLSSKQTIPLGLWLATSALAVLLIANELLSTPLRWDPTPPSTGAT